VRRLNPAVKAAMDDPTRERLETVILED